ncbi:hypothetical protein GCM10020254_51280 [Streptomyces goshikiensis]
MPRGAKARLCFQSVRTTITHMTRVLLAEDDASISEPLARALRREGYEVEVREDGPTALDAGLQGGVDLVVLDLGLPGMDGLEVARRLRAEGHGFPILVLTARADEVDTVVGLDAGADDYVTKPFRLAELLARVRALLRRGATEAAQSPATHGVRIDVESHRAWMGGRRSSSSPPRSSTCCGSWSGTPAGSSPATS